MAAEFIIYVDKEKVYSGSFSEVPEEHRGKIVDSLNDWGEVLGKNGLNEMIYSLFTWYEQVAYECADCNKSFTQKVKCADCGKELVQGNKYQQNQKITGLLDCVGMITHLEIVQ